MATSSKCLQYRIIFVHINGQHVTLQNFDVDIGGSHLSELPFTIFGAWFFYVYGLCLGFFSWLGVCHVVGAKCFQACLQFQTSIGCKGISMLK